MSKILKCQAGHYYDADKFTDCPYCNNKDSRDDIKIKGQLSDDMDDMVTVSKHVFIGSPRKMKKPHVTGSIVLPETMIPGVDMEAGDEDKTISIFKPLNGVDPVVGWLVCIDGEEQGRDFRLIRGFNHIGRNPDMDIRIKTDKKISRNKHCSLVYDDKGNTFYLIPGKGTLTYLKGEILLEPTQIQDGDEIEIGDSRFAFISFCKGDRVWKRE